ncbi:MAG TPA: SRPBCC domain-containing protein [Phycisphaerae bacterium]|jgi:hypothetical protein
MADPQKPSDRPFKEITLTRIFDAPRELVYKAWTDPLQLPRWFGPKTFTIPTCQLDPRVGGSLRIVMRSPQGTHHAMIGVYQEVIPNERLVFTNIPIDDAGNHLLEGLTIVTFETHLGRLTKLTLSTSATGIAPFAPQMLAGMEAGWSQSIDKLADMLSPPDHANGKICYIEIPATDIARSAAFYKDIFGWNVRTRDDGSTAFDDAAGQVSGSWRLDRKPSRDIGMVTYIMVDNIEKTMQLIAAGGGKIVQAVGMDAPEITARFADPAGNIFGLYQEPKQSGG